MPKINQAGQPSYDGGDNDTVTNAVGEQFEVNPADGQDGPDERSTDFEPQDDDQHADRQDEQGDKSGADKAGTAAAAKRAGATKSTK